MTQTEAIGAVPVLGKIRILDFTRHMSGPLATQFLSDFGAEVIKVEGLPSGDGSRHTGTVFHGTESGLFLIWNHGKRSVALDFRDPEAKPILERLIETSDVLVENFRPGVADELGFGYDYCKSINPRLIYASLSAFGQTGPWSKRPGTDPVVQAMSGLMSVTGEKDSTPVLVGVPIADFSSAMMLVQGILLAILARMQTGRGQKVELSMIAALIYSWTTRLAAYWGDGVDPVANGSAHSAVAPYQAFKTADGYVVAGVWGAGAAWPRFCAAIGRTDLTTNARFANNVSRMANRPELDAILEPIFESKPTAFWERRFIEENALFGPVYRFSDLLSQPQIIDMGIITTTEHTTLGTIPQVGPVIFLSDTPGRIRRPPPLLGEHTREVLSEIGFSDEQIKQYVSAKIASAAELA